MTDLNEHLKEFRAVEKDFSHTAVLLVDNLDAQRIIATWTTIPVNWEEPGSKPVWDSRLIWKCLWEGCEFDHVELQKLAVVTPQTFARLWEPIVSSRLVYPDGSMSSIAQSIIVTVIGKAAMKGMKL